jgi:hypothetical protein
LKLVAKKPRSLARVPAHGRVRVQGEAEDLEIHSHLFFEELPVFSINISDL